MGRPTKYKKEYCQQIVDYFSADPNRKELVAKSQAYGKGGNKTFEKDEWKLVPNELPTITKFSKKIGIAPKNLLEWTKKYPEFRNAYEYSKELYKNFLIENGLLGLYNAAFAIFVSKNTTDMRDKVETDVTSAGKALQPIQVVVYGQDDPLSKYVKPNDSKSSQPTA